MQKKPVRTEGRFFPPNFCRKGRSKVHFGAEGAGFPSGRTADPEMNTAFSFLLPFSASRACFARSLSCASAFSPPQEKFLTILGTVCE